MVKITKKDVDAATSETSWNFGNKLLYDMCKKSPGHTEESKVIAKVWLIGRAYAAAIERRRTTGNFSGDDFYVKNVAPKIVASEIDNWLDDLRGIRTVSKENLGRILLVHLKVTELFSAISGLNKRSLASKYLHFHFPRLFFIYDSRAVNAVSKLSDITGRVGRSTSECDNEYRKYCEKCLKIFAHVEEKHKVKLSPRHLDNLLLAVSAKP